MDYCGNGHDGSWVTRRNNAQPGDGLRAGLLQEVRKSLPPKQNWSTFLRNHASQIWACDFLQTYDILFRTLFVFVIIELGSRRVVHFGVTRHPTDQWIAQQLRNATPFGEGPRFLIQDSDRKYGASSDRVAAGIEERNPSTKEANLKHSCTEATPSNRKQPLGFRPDFLIDRVVTLL
jgi:hypothetical protein